MKQKMSLFLLSFIFVLSLMGCSKEKEDIGEIFEHFLVKDYEVIVTDVQARKMLEPYELYLDDLAKEELANKINAILKEAKFYRAYYVDHDVVEESDRTITLYDEDGNRMALYKQVYEIDNERYVVAHLSVIDGRDYIDVDSYEKINDLIDEYSFLLHPVDDYKEINLDYTIIDISSSYNGLDELDLNQEDKETLIIGLNDVLVSSTFYTKTHLSSICCGDIREIALTVISGEIIYIYPGSSADDGGCLPIASIYSNDDKIGYMNYEDYERFIEILDEYSYAFGRRDEYIWD